MAKPTTLINRQFELAPIRFRYGRKNMNCPKCNRPMELDMRASSKMRNIWICLYHDCKYHLTVPLLYKDMCTDNLIAELLPDIGNMKFIVDKFKIQDKEKQMTETKPTNPKDALGVKKVPLHCIPNGPLLELGLAMMEGGRKYGAHNYREMGVRMSTYYDAAMRHLIAWFEGEDIDTDSGVHHITKAIATLFVLRDSMIMGNCEDDRPIVYPRGINMLEFNKLAEELIEKYPDCVPPFIEVNHGLGAVHGTNSTS